MDRAVKPIFQKEESEIVFQRIKQRVHQTIRELAPARKKIILFKAFLFPALYILLYALALACGKNTTILYSCYFGLGLMLVIIFLNVIHDAVHGVVFNNKKWNSLYVYFFDLMGANSYIWKLRHTRLHHNYPNIMGWDSDIEQSGLARIFPHGPFSKMHRYQHIYLPMLYPFYLLNWLLLRDFKDFFNRKKIVWKIVQIPRLEFVKLFILKGFFLFYIVVLPKMLLPISWGQAITASLIMLFTASILSLLVLLSPHANTENEFPLPDEHNMIPHSWYMHQLCNTNDLVHDNWFTRFFMGNFNYHIAHHLFPSVNHIYYPDITRIIQEEAKKNGLPYKAYPLGTALFNHYKLLKKNRVAENIFEETM